MDLTKPDETKWLKSVEQQGRLNALKVLIQKGRISIKDVAEELGLDVAEIKKILRQ